MATVTLRVTEEERATIIAALLNYDHYWSAKAERGQDGRAACMLIANEANALYRKLSGMDLMLPILATVPQAASKPNSGPNGGLKVVAPYTPALPPSGSAIDF